MNLQFLGTAAAEGYPAIFCNCTNCNQARALGGRNMRYRSALLVNDDLLIDFGPDLMAAAQRFGRNLSRVTTTLVTHAHPDHFLLENAQMRRETFTAHVAVPTLHLFGPKEVIEAFPRPAELPAPSALPEISTWSKPAQEPGNTIELAALRMRVTGVHAFERWQAGTYRCQAFRAHHAVGALEALFYSIDDGQKAFLYASDTGPFPEDTWQALAGQAFDAIIMEETMGSGAYNQHMGFEDFFQHVTRMREMSLLRPGGRLIATHFSHTSNPSHGELEAIFNPRGIEVAYDGLTLDLV